jgi:hypothetical protein
MRRVMEKSRKLKGIYKLFKFVITVHQNFFVGDRARNFDGENKFGRVLSAHRFTVSILGQA